MNIIQKFKDEEVQILEQLNKDTIDGLTLIPKGTQIPVEICEEIFSYLTGPELTKCAQVAKDWQKVASQERLWNGIMQQYAIGPTKWKNIADLGKADPIPKEMLKILKQPCPFNEGKQVGQTHILVWIPSTINNKTLTLTTLGQFVKAKSFPNNHEGFAFFWSVIKNQIGDMAIEKPFWALMTKDVIPESRDKSYNHQIKMVGQFKEYEVPKALEATFCIFAEYVRKDYKTRLFGDKPLTYTICKEQINEYLVAVGGFAPTGLCISYDNYVQDDHGVAALRKFL